jgi:tyrosyl-tRNA synthetase
MSEIQVSVEEQMRVLMRGVEYGEPHIQSTMEEDLRQRLATGKPLHVYCGFDPTFTDLTLGNLVPMLKLRQFQRFGHEVVFLIGTMTGIVGDPSDKSAARLMLTVEDVEANSKSWLEQAYRVLDPKKTMVARNGDWLAPLTLTEVVHLASNFTVSQFLEHETFRRRMAEGKPLYIHEFIYALMQAYDAYTLKTDVQVGGVDQLFNIMAGRQLQRAKGEKPLIAVCTPLLIGTDGALKMSKSVGNVIGLSEPPSEMYGKLMSIPDSLILNYFTLLSDLTADELTEIEQGLSARTLNPMETKKRLAHSIVALLSGDQAADEAQAEFERVFQRREEPEAAAVEVALSSLPGVRDSEDANTSAWATVPLARLVSERAGISMSEARRLIDQGAVAINGDPVKEAQVRIAIGDLVRIGRHRFLRIILAPNA